MDASCTSKREVGRAPCGDAIDGHENTAAVVARIAQRLPRIRGTPFR
jgi:hypothetical protein